jgi:hypothetical protein
LVAEVEDVGDEVIDAVGRHRLGTGPGGVAALVGGDAPDTGVAQRCELRPPRTRRLGKPVQYHDGATIVGTTGEGAERAIPERNLDLVNGGRRYPAG